MRCTFLCPVAPPTARKFRGLVLTLVAALTIGSPKVAFGADPKVHVFDGDIGQVFDATVRAVGTNWGIAPYSDRAAGIVQFHTAVSLATWGEDCMVVLRDLGNGKIEASFKAKNSAQLIGWGAGNRIAKKLFESIKDELARPRSGSQQPASASPQK